MMDSKYRSRKFIVTMIVCIATFGLAVAGKMTNDVAMVFTALVGSYNAAQGFIDHKNAGV